MAKAICGIPLSRIRRVEIYINKSARNLEEVKEATGADYILNGGMWNADGSPCAGLKVGGKLLSKPPLRKVTPAPKSSFMPLPGLPQG